MNTDLTEMRLYLWNGLYPLGMSRKIGIFEHSNESQYSLKYWRFSSEAEHFKPVTFSIF